MKRCDLDHGTDHEDDGEAQERNPATKFVVCVRGKNGAEEATGCEEGDNVLGDVSVSLAGKSSGGQWQSEVDFEALEGEHRAHNTSVISYLERYISICGIGEKGREIAYRTAVSPYRPLWSTNRPGNLRRIR